MKKVYIATLLFFISFLQLYAQTCQPSYSSLPFSENFENSWQDLCGASKSMPSVYWLNQPLTGTDSWRRENEPTSANWNVPNFGTGYNSAGANNSLHSARFHSTYNVAGTIGSLSLYVDCSTGVSSKELNFYYVNNTGDDSLFVELSTDGGANFSTLRKLGSTSSGWILNTVGFTSTSASTIIKFKGKSGSYTYTDLFLDEVSVASVPCFTPASITPVPSLNSVKLTFSPSLSGAPTGYEYAVSTSNVPPANGTFTSSTTVNVAGLNASSTYYAYVRSVCSGNSIGNWLSQSFVTATANCIPQYNRGCVGNGEYSLIKVFDLKGENNTSIHTANPTCSSNYKDYSASSNITLAKGKSYSCVISIDTTNYFSAWIDFNNDNAYSIDEKVLDFFYRNDRSRIAIISLYVPANAQVGVHFLRLRMNSTDPCAVSDVEGQTHDYKVNIVDNIPAYAYNVSPGIINTCANGGGTTISSVSNNNNEWVPLLDSSNNIIASINANGNNLGQVSVSNYVNGGTLRTLNSKPYLDRNPQISVQYQPSTNVSIRIYLLKTEYDALKAADPSIKSLMDLWLTKTAQACASTIGAGLLIQPVSSGATGNGYYVEYSIPGFSSFYLQSAPSALPITLGSLNSKRLNNTNYLSWTTQSEQDNLGFDIEMSTDGIDFKKIAFVESKAVNGNSSATLNYSFDDGQAYSENTYYRLKQVTKDGKIVYSNIAMITGVPSRLKITSVFPNPVTSSVTLNVYSPVYEQVSVTVTTTSGKSLLSKTVVLQSSANNIKLNTSSLPAGTYFIKAVSSVSGVQSVSKFVKL